MGRVNHYHFAVLIGVLAVAGLIIRATLFYTNDQTSPIILIDPQITQSYHAEVSMVISTAPSKITLNQLYELLQSYIPSIEKIGIKKAARGKRIYRIVAQTPIAQLQMPSGKFILTHKAIAPLGTYTIHEKHALPTIIYPHDPDKNDIRLTQKLLQTSSTLEHPESISLIWNSPYDIECIYHTVPIKICAETALTQTFINQSIELADQNSKKTTRIDGRFDRMIILRGKGLP